MDERNGAAQILAGSGGARPTAERRVTSILFADLVGFTPFAEQLDPEEVRDVLSGYFDRCRDVIGRYGGTVEKFIGDAVMAVWGVPTTHEDDAERTVRAGLELVETIPAYGAQVGASSLQVRVGIATGEVAVTIGAVGEGMVSGDAVNTASRVQARATPGEVWVDDQTVALTAATIQYDDMGEHMLKGKAMPQRLRAARAVITADAGPVGDHLAVPLVGYRRELATVKETYHATVNEGRGRLLLVVGEPGIGKTRLAHELQAYLDGLSSSIYWHRGQCLAYGEGIVYSALVHAVSNRMGVTETDSAATVVDRIESALRERDVDDRDRSWLAPRLAVLLGVTAGSFAREDLFAAWLQWFELLGGDGSPIVWVVEDAHHADDALLDFIEHLVRSSTVPVFVLALARPEIFDRRPRIGSGRRSASLNLEGLADDDMGELVDALIADLPADRRQALVRHADGIPLYAIETVRAMLDRGTVIQQEHDRRTLAGTGVESRDAPAMPASLHMLVSSRLDLLPDEDRALLQDAAVLGLIVDRADLLFLTQREEDEVDAIIGRLKQRDLIGTITDRFSPHAGSYAFVQSVVRQVAYERLSRRDRVNRHVRLANYLMDQEVAGDRAALVAQHLTHAIALTPEHDPLRVALADQRASWLERAGDRASSVGAHADALRLYELALAHVDDEPARTRLLLRAAEAANVGGKFHVAIEHARAVDTADASSLATATYIEVAALRYLVQGPESAKPLLRFSTPEALAGVEPVIASRVAYYWATMSWQGLAEGDALAWSEWAYRWAAASGDPIALARALHALNLMFSMRSLPGIPQLFAAEEIRIAREHHLIPQLCDGLLMQAVFAIHHDLNLALENGREVLQMERQSGNLDWSYTSHFNYCNALWLAGEWDECLHVEADRHQPEAEISPTMYGMPQMPVLLIRHARGEKPEVPPPWRDLETQEAPSPYLASTQAIMIGLSHMLRGNSATAAGHARTSVSMLYEGTRLDDDFVYYWQLALEWTIAAGEFDRVDTLLDLVAREPAPLVSPLLKAQLNRLRGTAHALDPHTTRPPDAIEADLRAGIEGLDRLGVVPSGAQGRATLGIWLVRQGRSDEAIEPLRSAVATFTRLRAQRWLDELAEELPFGLRDVSAT